MTLDNRARKGCFFLLLSCLLAGVALGEELIITIPRDVSLKCGAGSAFGGNLARLNATNVNAEGEGRARLVLTIRNRRGRVVARRSAELEPGETKSLDFEMPLGRGGKPRQLFGEISGVANPEPSAIEATMEIFDERDAARTWVCSPREGSSSLGILP